LQFVVSHAIDFFPSDETSPNRFVDGLFQLASVHVSALEQIHDRSERTCHAYPVHFLNVACVELAW
jgi:hypothetical protein